LPSSVECHPFSRWFLCVYSQPPAPDVSSAMACRVACIRSSLRGTNPGSEFSLEPAAARSESLVLCAFWRALFPGSAALLSAEGLEIPRTDCLHSLRILGCIQCYQHGFC